MSDSTDSGGYDEMKAATGLRIPSVESRRAVERLGSISGADPEGAHDEADAILLALVDPEVRDAYNALVRRAPWWASA